MVSEANKTKRREHLIKMNSIIIDRCLQGDETAVNDFFHLNKPLINSMINYYSKQLPYDHKADLKQEAFCGFLIGLKKFDKTKLKEGKPETFFFVYILSSIQRYAKKVTNENRVCTQTLDIQKLLGKRTYYMDIVVNDNLDLKKLLRKFMSKLSYREKIIVKYRWFLKKRSNEDIAQQLSVSREFVRKRDLRLQKKFFDMLSAEGMCDKAAIVF